MKYEEIFSVLDQMFGAKPGTAESSVPDDLVRSHYRRLSNPRLNTGGDDWSVKKTSDSTAAVSRPGRGYSNEFRALIVATQGEFSLNLAGRGITDPAEVTASVVKEVRVVFKVVR